MTVDICVMSVCLTFMVSLVLVLRHLKALHLTKSQDDKLRHLIANHAVAVADNAAEWRKDLEDTKAKLSALSNRVR